MFDEADPLLARVRAMALAFPGAAEKISHGRPMFFTTAAFAVYGGSDKPSGRAYPRSVLVKVGEVERRALLGEPWAFLPAYLGPSGWVGCDLECSGIDWGEVGELLDMSFRSTAPARWVRALDGSGER